jgi:hypothetical protein
MIEANRRTIKPVKEDSNLRRRTAASFNQSAAAPPGTHNESMKLQPQLSTHRQP